MKRVHERLDRLDTHVSNIESHSSEIRAGIIAIKINLDHANSKIETIDKKIDAIIAIIQNPNFRSEPTQQPKPPATSSNP